MTYDGADDSRKCHALAVEMLRGHARIITEMDNGTAELRSFRGTAEGTQQFSTPMSRDALEILLLDVAKALQIVR